MTELELIEGLKRGDESAFRVLVEQYQDLVYNTALGVVQNAADAEDVAQEVFIQIFRSIGTFKSEAKLSTWIYRITTTRALDLLRARKSKKRFGLLKRLWETEDENPLDTIEDFNHPGVALERKEDAAKLFEAIGQLPENQKVAFVLHKLEGLSYQEISEIMGNTVPAVESLMHRARLNLKKILEKKILNP
ncbi:MAG: RNA polymerase sigma factor [Chitinophagia bacterium]|nr:RNA polymerase sigma factor [Chitinophagia bacterium]NDE79098.1 RNA polymerase sigma factor [Chitinophagaceae bacterium]